MLLSQVTGSLFGRNMAVSGFPDSSVGKESACNAGGSRSIAGLGRSTGHVGNYSTFNVEMLTAFSLSPRALLFPPH